MTSASKRIYQEITKDIKSSSQGEEDASDMNQRIKRIKRREMNSIFDAATGIDEQFDYFNMASMLNRSPRRGDTRRPPSRDSLAIPIRSDEYSQSSPLCDCLELVTMTQTMYIKEKKHQNEG
mmetsp:Transcript_27549/g.75182  ORF Transcript_27549/g.75182 Transcript_27549/m.75182 type:complete len:122 (+) Transcript_27549:335-700(+)